MRIQKFTLCLDIYTARKYTWVSVLALAGIAWAGMPISLAPDPVERSRTNHAGRERSERGSPKMGHQSR